MNNKDILGMKQTIYRMGVQHNKLTGLVVACLDKIKNLEQKINNLESKNNLDSNSKSNFDVNLNSNLDKNNSVNIENQASELLKSLNINN